MQESESQMSEKLTERDTLIDIATKLMDGGQKRHNLLLMGAPGGGKTSFAYKLAATVGVRIYKAGCTPGGMAQEIIGGAGPDMSGTWRSWMPGPAAMAMGDSGHEPGWLLLDDVHLAGMDIHAAMQTVCDVGIGGTFTRPDGVTVTPHDNFRVIATSNKPFESLPEWLSDRFSRKVWVYMPSSEMLAALRPELQAVVAWDYEDNPAPLCTYRTWAAISDGWDAVGLRTSVEWAIGDKVKAASVIEALAAVGVADAKVAWAALRAELAAR